MFHSFCFNKVSSKAFRIACGDSCVDPAENQKLLLSVNNSRILLKRDFDLIRFAMDWCKNCSGGTNFFRIFGVTEVFESYRLLQTVLFLTDSVFYVLFAYFDESMSGIGGYEP